MADRVDLHTHSTASDGADEPAQVVRNAKAAGIQVLALTDHDTVAGLDEAEAEARRLGLGFVRGVELSSMTEQGEMHILGLWVPKDAEPLEKALAAMRRQREERNLRMLGRLKELGLSLSMEEVVAESSSCVGRPHIARARSRSGQGASGAEAVSRYLGQVGRAFVPRRCVSAPEAVSLLAGLGCCVVLAHPMLRPSPQGWLESFVRELVPLGLSGLEVWHSAHDEGASRRLQAMAKSLGLCASGGSDYHGANKPGVALGLAKGKRRIPGSAYDALLAWRRERGLPL